MAFHSIARASAQLAAISTTWLFLANPAQAFFPLVTDDTGTQGTAGNQIEISYSFNKSVNSVTDENGRFVERAQGIANAFPLTYTRGISENIDVFFGVARQTSPARGWESSEIGLKWVFAGDQTQGWSAAIKPTITLPVSTKMQDRGLGTAKTNVAVTLISSYLTDTYEWHFNAGYAGNRQAVTAEAEAERQNLWSVSVAPVIVLNPQWKLAFDAGLQTNPGENSRYSAFGEVGLVYAPIENLQLGLGVIVSPDLNAKSKAYSYTLTTGLAYQF